MERDGGTLYHAVNINEDDYPSWKTALCGAKPGRTGNGWSSYTGEKVTCPRCNKRLKISYIARDFDALEAERDYWKARAEKAEEDLKRHLGGV